MSRITSFAQYEKEYEESIQDPASYWEKKADTFQWNKRWDQVVSWEFDTPKVEWFINGKLNITENCLDRHVANHPDKTAIIWEPNEIDEQGKAYSYKELLAEVCKAANLLADLGVKKGD